MADCNLTRIALRILFEGSSSVDLTRNSFRVLDAMPPSLVDETRASLRVLGEMLPTPIDLTRIALRILGNTGEAPPNPTPAPTGGILYISVGGIKTVDSYYNKNEAIPDPTFRIAFIGE